MVLAAKPNLLVLDEPTNDLDLDTLRALEAFLDEWPGALVVASHDRTFLDRTVDHVLAIDSAGEVARVPGGVQGWLAGRAAPAPTSTRPIVKVKGGKSPRERKASQYTLGRQIRDTEQAMAKAQQSVDRLNERLVATIDHAELSTLGADLAAAQHELAVLEERWLELAERQSG
jgi:ATP-binding cassette subfamily F protein uup